MESLLKKSVYFVEQSIFVPGTLVDGQVMDHGKTNREFTQIPVLLC